MKDRCVAAIVVALLGGCVLLCGSVGANDSSPNFAPLPTAMGERDGGNYVARLKAVDALGKTLGREETDALLRLLNRKNGADPLPAGELNALKDQVAITLRSQERLPPGLVGALDAMYRDAEHDVVWRDYCIQHMGSLLPRLTGADAQVVLKTLREAAEEPEAIFAGTALIALSKNIGRGGITAETVAERALATATGESSIEAARVTALQISARLGDRRALPAMRKLAAAAESVILRISAIGALGQVGDKSDLPLLKQIASGDNVRLQPAARTAIRKLTL